MKKYSGVIAVAILAAGYAPAQGEELLAARNIRAGDIIVADDIVTPKGREGIRQATILLGLEAARNIYRGQPIDEDDLRAPTVVARNEIVKMEFASGPLFITTEGRALDQGAMGERIRVMNLISKRVVSATIVSSNTVRTLQ